jgi:hypothetical protein
MILLGRVLSRESLGERNMTHWKYTLNISKIWNDDHMPVENKGKAIAAKIRQTLPDKWFDFGNSSYNEEIDEIAERFNNVTGWDGVSPTEEFNIIMNELYDFGDRAAPPFFLRGCKMAWIETIQ